MPQYAVRTQRPGLARLPCTYCTGPWGKRPVRPYVSNAELVRVASTYPTEAPGVRVSSGPDMSDTKLGLLVAG